MAGAVEFHEAFAFRIDRSPRVIGRAFKVDIGRQHDSGTLALGNQLDRFFQRSDIACSISRNSTGSFPECNFRNRTVDLHIAFHHVQFSYGNALGDNQGVAGSCGFDSGIARAVQRDSRFRKIDDKFIRSGHCNIDGLGSLAVLFGGVGESHLLVGLRQRNGDLLGSLLGSQGVRNLDGRRSRWSGRYGNIRSAVFDCLSYLTDAFYFRNHFINGTVCIEIRIDRHADRAFLGQQVARHIGAVVASDGNVGESVVRADRRSVIEERHREVGKRGLGFRGPEEVHRDRTVGLGQLTCRIGHVGRSAHFARQGVERRGQSLESDTVARGLQRLVFDFVQVVGLYHQQTERTLQGYRFRERTGNFETLFGEKRVALVAVAHERPDFRDRLQIRRIVDLVRKVAFAALGAVGPEDEVVGLRRYEPQVIERNRLAAHALFDAIVQLVAVVDFQNTAVDRGAGAESIGHGTGLYSALRNRYRKRGCRCYVGNEPFILLTRGKGHRKAHRQ